MDEMVFYELKILQVVMRRIRRISKELIALLLINFYHLLNLRMRFFFSIYFHNPPRLLFAKIIKWLLSNGYRIISIKEFEDLLNKNNIPKKYALITFDDGWSRNLELIEIIEECRIPIALFISTGAIVEGNFWWEYAVIPGQDKLTGVYDVNGFKKLPTEILEKKLDILKEHYNLKRSALTLDELIEIGENPLITIGSHTVTHPILVNCSPERQNAELSNSKLYLEKWLKRPIEYIAYPNGDFNMQTIENAKKIGYKLGFTTIQENLNFAAANPLQIPRYCVNDHGGYFENIAKLMGIWQIFFRK